ncbi:MAG: glycosyltransferase [Candidatus Falkowbacteria bacterium]
MKIALGFITYNTDTAKYLPYFLDSLFKSLEYLSPEDYLILARDNSEELNNYNLEYIKNVFNKDEELIKFRWSEGNVGFSRAYNVMISEAKDWGAEAFLMINPDTIIAPETIKKLVEALSSDNMLGSVTPKILRWDFVNQKLSSKIDTCGLSLLPGLKFVDIGQGLEDTGQFQGFPILGPSGAAGFYRMSALERVKEKTGYLDERMFMYKEDCDLAYRLFLAGFSSKIVPEALVYHDRSVSAAGRGVLAALNSRAAKSRQVRSWSFLNQHLLMIKFWSKQNLTNKVRILAKLLLFGLYALFFEPFLLNNYSKIREYIKVTRADKKAID